uniref:Uncharacterized protein n=1 Tax=Octopus bimaculoides TaxID=37653 RepID=A0A0L8GW47_OCTBM
MKLGERVSCKSLSRLFYMRITSKIPVVLEYLTNCFTFSISRSQKWFLIGFHESLLLKC